MCFNILPYVIGNSCILYTKEKTLNLTDCMSEQRKQYLLTKKGIKMVRVNVIATKRLN